MNNIHNRRFTAPALLTVMLGRSTSYGEGECVGGGEGGVVNKVDKVYFQGERETERETDRQT